MIEIELVHFPVFIVFRSLQMVEAQQSIVGWNEEIHDRMKSLLKTFVQNCPQTDSYALSFIPIETYNWLSIISYQI